MKNNFGMPSPINGFTIYSHPALEIKSLKACPWARRWHPKLIKKVLLHFWSKKPEAWELTPMAYRCGNSIYAAPSVAKKLEALIKDNNNAQ